jgi:hypothetical protein
MSDATSSLDRRSVIEGAVYAAIISGAAGITQAVVDSDALVGLLLLVIVVGFVFGGFVAGRGHFGSAARHGAAAAALAFVVVQAVLLVRVMLVGDSVNVVSIIAGALTAAVCGTLGGLLALRSPGPDAVRRNRGRDRR